MDEIDSNLLPAPSATDFMTSTPAVHRSVPPKKKPVRSRGQIIAMETKSAPPSLPKKSQPHSLSISERDNTHCTNARHRKDFILLQSRTARTKTGTAVSNTLWSDL